MFKIGAFAGRSATNIFTSNIRVHDTPLISIVGLRSRPSFIWSKNIFQSGLPRPNHNFASTKLTNIHLRVGGKLSTLNHSGQRDFFLEFIIRTPSEFIANDIVMILFALKVGGKTTSFRASRDSEYSVIALILLLIMWNKSEEKSNDEHSPSSQFEILTWDEFTLWRNFLHRLISRNSGFWKSCSYYFQPGRCLSIWTSSLRNDLINAYWKFMQAKITAWLSLIIIVSVGWRLKPMIIKHADREIQ